MHSMHLFNGIMPFKIVTMHLKNGTCISVRHQCAQVAAVDDGGHGLAVEHEGLRARRRLGRRDAEGGARVARHARAERVKEPAVDHRREAISLTRGSSSLE